VQVGDLVRSTDAIGHRVAGTCTGIVVDVVVPGNNDEWETPRIIVLTEDGTYQVRASYNLFEVINENR